MEHYSGYSEDEILPCADELADLLYRIKDSPYQATRKKYASGRFFRYCCHPLCLFCC